MRPPPLARYCGRSTPTPSGPRCGAASSWSSRRWVAWRCRELSSRCCGPPPEPSTSARTRGWPVRSPPPVTRRSSRWKRPPNSLTCSPMRARWTLADGACWFCWTRCAPPSAGRHLPRAVYETLAARVCRPTRLPNAPAPQFEVMYLLAVCDAAAADQLRDRLKELGESVAIAAAPPDSYSVHVHTDDAGAAVEAGLAVGRVSRIVISALGSGTSGLPAGGWTRGRAVLAVVDGDGAAELFAGEGACVLRPGPDAVTPAADISAHQLVRAVVDTGAAHVMVLPNGYVAAEELVAGCTAAIGWGVDVVPVPTGSMVQGLAALAVHDAARQAVDDGYSMARAAGASRHGSVRIATQKALTWAGTCKPGDGLGIAGDEVLIVADDVAAAAIGLVDLLLASGGDLVTVLIGAGVTEDVAVVLERHVHDHHPGTELVSYRTGHRGDALLIGVE
ncbi:conserved hypothetical protein [Mycobacterium tuberculosis T85]|nr:conserved hypothetical protein [Mycobacterium tuberculosis T85]